MSAADSGKHKIVTLKTYLGVGTALMVLTVVTVAVSFLDLGGWNAIVAIVIASVKALLVAMIFMHLYYDKKLYLIIFLASLVMLTVFIAFTMFDTLRRGDIYLEAGMPYKPEAIIYEKAADSTSVEITADSISVDSNTEH